MERPDLSVHHLVLPVKASSTMSRQYSYGHENKVAGVMSAQNRGSIQP